MNLAEIIQTIYGIALGVVLFIYGNKLLDSYNGKFDDKEPAKK